MKTPHVVVLGWCGFLWSEVVVPVGYTAKFSEMAAYCGEINIKFTAVVDIPAVSTPTVHPLTLLKHCGIGLMHERSPHLRVSFYFDQSYQHLCKKPTPISILICLICQVYGLFKEPTNRDLYTFVNQI